MVKESGRMATEWMVRIRVLARGKTKRQDELLR